MKKSLILVLPILALVSCKKTQESGMTPESLAINMIPVIFNPVTKSSIITYSDKTVPPILVNRIISGNMSTWIMADTAGKVIYLAYNMNDVTGAIGEVVFPNIPPFPLNPADKFTWKRCMGRAITLCAVLSCCTRELYVGCLASWAAACWWDKKIFDYQIKTLDKAHLIINLPPLVKV